MTFIQHPTQQKQGIHYFQVHRKHSPKYTISCIVKPTLKNGEESKPLKMFSDHNELQVQPTKKEIRKISKTHGNETTYHQINHGTKRKTQGK